MRGGTRDMTFGELLREKRRAAGVSQRELAAGAGLDFSYISKLENGRIPPPAADTVVALCRILKIEPEELLAASQMSLTENEWKELSSSLKRLRDS
ncbi:MAG: hypothetical protein DMF21_13770 [Verrucomicrobia bacterium]|nr:MAG: hypothetical protein DMF21_13770 [Verrucomicrobiota bacterium]